VRAPHSAILETMNRDGRHHLFVSESLGGVKRLSTTMSAHVGDQKTQMWLNWSEPEGTPYVRYKLYYGTDPDLLDGTEAAEGPSPIDLAPSEIAASLTDLDFEGQQWYAAIKGVDGLGQEGPLGLPLALLFDYDFSPIVSAERQIPCPAHIVLRWDAIPGASAYNIYRTNHFNPDPGDFELLATVGGDPTLATGLFCGDPAATGPIAQIQFTDVSPTTFSYYMLKTVFKSGGSTVETGGGNIALAYGYCGEDE
jgi:hypothetical protein